MKKRGDRNTHLLGTVLVAFGEGGVRGRAGLGAGAKLDSAVGELAIEDAYVAVGFGAVVRNGDREAMAGHLRLYRGVFWHGSDGNCDSRIWKNEV